MTKCQICGHDNPEGVEYCEDCGAALVASATPQTTPIPASSTPPASGAPGAASTPSGTPVPPAAAPAAADASPGAVSADAPPPAASPEGEPAVASASPTPPDATSQTTGQNARLVARRYGATSGEEYPLLGDQLVVGRFDPETGPVDIDLSQIPEAPQLSRHHAELYREADGRWHVKDLGSTNGVFIKSTGSATFGPRLTAPQALTSGDEVAFGNARFIFRLD